MWGLFRRTPRLPADRRPPLDRDERVLAWSPVAEAGTVVATNRGLWLPGETERLGWHQIHKAVWAGRELAVTPAVQVQDRVDYTVVADGPVRTYLLLEPDDVPHQVRARVTGSVAYTQHYQAPGGGVRVVGRRVSGVDGLTWTVRFDPGVDFDSPPARTAVDELVARARAAAAPSAAL
jgi:hypothetical protein